MSDHSEIIACDGFTIAEIDDNLDPYGLITVADEKGNISFFAADEMIEDKWVVEGIYTITYKNRLGYGYSFQVKVNENNNAVIVFEGAASENLSAVAALYGDKNVSLPDVTRIGYDFAGYVDQDGNIYENEISSILFRGQLVLNTTWKAKKFKLSTVVNGKKTDCDIYYGQEIDIPKPVVPDGYEFVGWTLDGNDYDETTIQLTEEKDIVFIAKLKTVSILTTDTEKLEEKTTTDTDRDELSDVTENTEPENKSNAIWIVIIVITLTCVVGGGAYWFFKIRKPNDNRDDNEVK